MEASRASKAYKGEVSRVVAAFHGDYAQRLFHGGIGDGDNPLGEFDRCFEGGASALGGAARSPKEFRKAALRRFHIEPELSPQEKIRVEPAEEEIRVSDRRLAPATAVT